jgi:hypothetical protein
MPQSGRNKFLKTTCKSSSRGERLSKEKALGISKVAGANRLRHLVNHSDGSKKPHHSFNLPQRLSGYNSAEARVVGGIPANLGSNSFSAEPLKSPGIGLDKLPKNSSNLLNRNVNSSNVLKEDSVRNGSGPSNLLSALIDKHRLVMHKSNRSLSEKEIQSAVEKPEQLPHAKRHQLFQALSKKPLPYLELHVRFGVSKQTMRGFIRRGWLTEMWGQGGVGTRFRLSEKGRNHLRELEAAAKYKTKATQKDLIRLRQQTFL